MPGGAAVWQCLRKPHEAQWTLVTARLPKESAPRGEAPASLEELAGRAKDLAPKKDPPSEMVRSLVASERSAFILVT